MVDFFQDIFCWNIAVKSSSSQDPNNKLISEANHGNKTGGYHT